MIDIHCHILPGIDDGPQTIKQSLSIAESLVAKGYRQIIATPHTRDGIFNVQSDSIYAKTIELNQALQNLSVDLAIYPGAEYPLIPELLDSELVTLNNSRYLLVELPFTQPVPQYAEDLFFQLQTKGLVPILAHPERCRGIQENPDLVKEYARLGVLLQVNIASIFGRYGRGVRQLAENFIKQGLIHFLATDSHRPFKYDLEQLQQQLGKTSLDKYTAANPQAVLANSNDHISPPLEDKPKASFLNSISAVFRHRWH
jgi:protein-tyrosine phosphatase